MPTPRDRGALGAMRDDPTRSRSPFLVRLSGPYLRRYARRRFHAVRVTRDGIPPPITGPLIVFTNHPSWWDPVIVALLTPALFPGRAAYGPMDEAALGRYGILRKLGVFGIDPHTRAGAARFLRVTLGLLQRPDTLLWITAQGAFSDVRARPVRLRPGTAHLAHLATLLPLAIELTFWNEAKPEILLRFGRPLAPARHEFREIEQALETTMDRLADDSITRDPARFVSLLTATTGIGGVYDAWRRLRAWSAGRGFTAAHEP